MTEQETANPFRTYLKVAVSGLLTELGFTSAENVALETLTEPHKFTAAVKCLGSVARILVR